MKTPLRYGWRNRRLISIQDVPSGLACNCICPACLRPLVARKGPKTVHHFAHHQGEDCPFALETTLHLLAKGILAREKRLLLPAVYLGNHCQPIFPSRTLFFDQVWIEHRTHHVIPDLLIRAGKRYLLVEIAYTHPCSREKLEKIRQLGLPAFEITLPPATDPLLNENQLRELLQSPDTQRRWLFNPKQQALEAQLRKKCDRKKVKFIGKDRKKTYAVYPCPQKRRRWDAGNLRGQTFANVFRDCLHCPFCLEIQFREDLRAFRWLPTLPIRVFCWGKEERWLEQFEKPK